MRVKRLLQKFIVVLAGTLALSGVAFGQEIAAKRDRIVKPAPTPKVETEKPVEDTSKPDETAPAETNPKKAEQEKDAKPDTEPVVSTTPSVVVSAPDEDKQDEEAVAAVYNNVLKDYKLGPEDVISVEVFAQCPNYCKTGISVPPTGRISYPLIKEGVLVAGKTVEQVAEEITTKLDEYIIDPKVTVTLDKVMSARYSVLGDVVTPGVRPMARRISIFEAVGEAGGLKETGSTKIKIIRTGFDGMLKPIDVNLKEIEKGKAEMVYLQPGDQVIVPGNRFKKIGSVTQWFSIASFARIFFTGGF